MILKLSMIGMFIVLIAVVVLVYYTQLEGFDNASPAINTVSSTVNPIDTSANMMPSTNAVTITLPLTSDKASSQNVIAPVDPVAASSAANLSKPLSVVPTLGTAGPAPYSSVASNDMPSNNTLAAAAPVRHDVMPQVSVSDTGYNAMSLQQKSDLLSNIQKIFRNELLSNRSTDASVIDKTASVSTNSSSTNQGKEYTKSSSKESCDNGEDEYRCPKNPDGTCPPVPDMTQYIKKDAIPCWGCSIDY
jgi:hypothetical protein